jgi:hypothetical protein
MLQEKSVEGKEDITQKHHTDMHPIRNPEPKPKPDRPPGVEEKETNMNRGQIQQRRSRMHKQAEMDERFQLSTLLSCKRGTEWKRKRDGNEDRTSHLCEIRFEIESGYNSRNVNNKSRSR